MSPNSSFSIDFDDYDEMQAALDILSRLRRLFGKEKSLIEIQHEIKEERLLTKDPGEHHHLLDDALKEVRIAEEKAQGARRSAQEATNLIDYYNEKQ